MRVISWRWTFFYKRIFPAFWFGFLAIFFAVALLSDRARADLDPVFLIVPAAMAVFGWFIMRKFVFDLADEVVDSGDALIVRKMGKEARIPLADIINVDSSTNTRPPRITLSLRTPSRFGRKIAFSPPPNGLLASFASNAIAEELIDRVDRARRGDFAGWR